MRRIYPYPKRRKSVDKTEALEKLQYEEILLNIFCEASDIYRRGFFYGKGQV